MWRPKGWRESRAQREVGMKAGGIPLNALQANQEAFEAGADAMLEATIKWLLEYDNYSQYTGRDHSDLVRRLDIPNKDMEAFTGKKY